MSIDWDTLEDVYEAIRLDASFGHLRLGKNRLVPGEGDNPIAMLIGEAPGAQEAMQLRPFVGKSGVMLRRLMELANLSSSPSNMVPEDGWEPNCWLTNVIKYRPPKNRTPTQLEIKDARPYLRQEWAAIGYPDIIVTIGSPALTAVCGRSNGVLARAGQPFTNRNNNRNPEVITVWPMIHPSYGLRNEKIRPEMENHWIHLGEWLYGYKKIKGNS